MIEINLISTQEAFTIASTLLIAVAPLSIFFCVCEKLLGLFISMISGGRIKL